MGCMDGAISLPAQDSKPIGAPLGVPVPVFTGAEDLAKKLI